MARALAAACALGLVQDAGAFVTAPLQSRQTTLRGTEAVAGLSNAAPFEQAAPSAAAVPIFGGAVVAAAAAAAGSASRRRAQKALAKPAKAVSVVRPQQQPHSARCGKVQRRLFFGDEDPYEKCTAVKLQVGLQFSKQFLDTLNKLSETCETDTPEGLHQLMLDVVLALRRAETSWRYGSVERLVFDSDDPAREAGSAIQRWGLEGQTKFGDDNEWDKLDAKAPKGMTEYVVLTVLVSCFGPVCGDTENLKIRTGTDVKKILDAMSGIQVDELVQLDVQWIPEEDGDSLSAMEVTMKFPELANI